MVITQDKAVFVWVISLNFHSNNFSLLFCKLDLAKIYSTQQDLLCTVTVTAKQPAVHIALIFAAGKTKQKPHRLLDLLFWHQILSLLLLPLLFYEVQASGFMEPATFSCYTPTLASHFISLPPSLQSSQLVSRPRLAQATPAVCSQANRQHDVRTLLFKPPQKATFRGPSSKFHTMKMLQMWDLPLHFVSVGRRDGLNDPLQVWAKNTCFWFALS